ncbi:polysaccharide deacetylase family protein [Anaeromyxobacter terrae]|uniref:polysaccharide deacetylase family protein n=1 Tax=Anaeromyxobacter terrae TaxID=2925406 RepID=UPI001F58EC21|nr:polysaccharide deacetylase family protein [Anaeromyxobacter sp. SG22]
MGRRVFILLYHHVGAPPRDVLRRKLWVTPGLIALHVRFLRALGYRFTTVSEALATDAGRLACVTFDDGFRDNVDLGLPALRALGVPGTVYVVTGEVGRQAVSFDEETGTGASDMASWDDLRKLRDAGWEVGSHGAAHRRLARLPADEQRRLVAASREALARELGSPPRSFAFPYGSYSAETLHAVREAGFESALTTRRGVAREDDDPFQLPRVTIGGQHALHAVRALKLALVEVGLLPLHRPPLVGGAGTAR